MFGSFMEHRIRGNVNCCLIDAIHRHNDVVEATKKQTRCFLNGGKKKKKTKHVSLMKTSNLQGISRIHKVIRS